MVNEDKGVFVDLLVLAAVDVAGVVIVDSVLTTGEVAGVEVTLVVAVVADDERLDGFEKSITGVTMSSLSFSFVSSLPYEDTAAVVTVFVEVADDDDELGLLQEAVVAGDP